MRREEGREDEEVKGEGGSEGEWGEDTCNKSAKILLLL